MEPIVTSLRDAEPACFWLDDDARPVSNVRLWGVEKADLAIVGGGFTGLWAALRAIEEKPDRKIVLLESTEVGDGASGRNGGFASPSITHGLVNGLHHFPEEVDQLEEAGQEAYRGLVRDVERLGIDAQLEETGVVGVAREAHEVDAVRAYTELLNGFGQKATFLDENAVRAEINSPTYRAGVWHHAGGILNPARLAWGLMNAVQQRGVTVWERCPVLGMDARQKEIELTCPNGRVVAQRVLLATNAFRSPLRRVRRATIPIWDYALMSEPLNPSQKASIGWRHRQGVGDASNRFHYYRLTSDDRILWGGYDAIYHFANRLERSFEQRPDSFEGLAKRFFIAFPQLEGLRFTHRWGGPIASTTRFCMDVGTACGGRVSWATGYTGSGVVASRFGGHTALDLIDHPEKSSLSLALVRTRAFPWPPEPIRWLGVAITQRALARADRTGHRGPWLRLLDRLGLGFAS